MDWTALKEALCKSKAPDEYGYSTISVNPIYKEINGDVVEISCDYHVLNIVFIGKFKDKYKVKVRIDNTGTVRAEISIEGIGNVSFFVSQESGYPTIPGVTQSRLNVQSMGELNSICSWIYNAYLNACSGANE